MQTLARANTIEALTALDEEHVWFGSNFRIVNHDGVYRTANAGDSWDYFQQAISSAFLYDMHFYNENDGLAVGKNGQVRRTSDGGDTWQPQTTCCVSLPTMNKVAVSGSKIWAAGNNGQVPHSNDDGVTWEVIQTQTSFDLLNISIFPTADLDGDNDVDGSDFLEWQRSGGDLAEWQAGYGGAPSFLAVPEPTTVALLAVGIVAAIARRWGSRYRDHCYFTIPFSV